MNGRLAITIVLAGILCALPTALGATAPPEPWGGDGCAASEELEAVLDRALAATPAGEPFPGRGSGAPGYSAALLDDECGLFSYAAGRRAVGPDQPMQVRTRQHVGSMTKPVTSALTLILSDQGAFGAKELETPVSTFFSKAERTALTKGVDGANPLCPVRVQGIDRKRGTLGRFRARCPKLRKITLRHLLNGNHGLWDFANELDRNMNGSLDFWDYVFADLFDAIGLERLPSPERIDGPFDLLTTIGLLRNKQAKIGKARRQDFEVSFGNTGYELLGLILERVSGAAYDDLVDRHIVEPLGLDPMTLVTGRPKNGRRLATPYALTTGAGQANFDGASVDESLLGVFPLTDVNGHRAIDSFDFEPFILTNSGGGAGGLSATPASYVRFFRALIGGGLLTPAAQARFDAGFLRIEGEEDEFEHGFGLFSAPSLGLGRLVSKGGATSGSACIAIHSLAATGGTGATAVVCRNSQDLFLPNDGAGLPNTSAAVVDLAVELLIETTR